MHLGNAGFQARARESTGLVWSITLYQKVRKSSKSNAYMSKGHRIQLEGDLTGQIGDDFSIKINNIRRL